LAWSLLAIKLSLGTVLRHFSKRLAWSQTSKAYDSGHLGDSYEQEECLISGKKGDLGKNRRRHCANEDETRS
jgi:hypothetical protein